jgi:hypothetical protein
MRFSKHAPDSPREVQADRARSLTSSAHTPALAGN